jgi:preprotein translocase subunit SecG
MTSILFFVQAGLVVMIVIAVLLQKSSSIGLGAYSGTNESVFGAKGPAGFLTKVTFVLGFLFLVNTITLGYMYAQQKNDSVTDALVDKNNIVAPTINVVNDINTTK